LKNRRVKTAMLNLKKNENCTYLHDVTNGLVYISLSFEDLRYIEKCNDYMVVDIVEYCKENHDINDPILELIKTL
jgi:hypothetical protein